MEGLDELAKALFPGNRNHQRTFLVIFAELKWAEGTFLPALDPLAQQHGISPRTLQTVRAKMRRLGLAGAGFEPATLYDSLHGFRAAQSQ